MIKRSGSVFGVMAAFGPMLGLLVAAVITYVMPKMYESEATVEVRPIFSNIDSESLASSKTQEIISGKEFEQIKSRASLERVIGKLELTNKWGVDQETALRILDEIVSTKKIAGTDLISVRVRHTDKELARDIAAEVPIALKNYLDDLRNRDLVPALAELDKAVKAQEDKVEERRKVLAASVRGFLTDVDSEKLFKDLSKLYQQENEELQAMRSKQIKETLRMKMPNDSVVIHEDPQISHIQVSPNMTLNLLLGMGLGLLISPLLAFAVTIANGSPQIDRCSLET